MNHFIKDISLHAQSVAMILCKNVALSDISNSFIMKGQFFNGEFVSEYSKQRVASVYEGRMSALCHIAIKILH